MAIDLTNARKRVSDRVFSDRVTISRDPVTKVRTIDDDTGLALPNPDDDATVLAVAVPCSIRESSLLERGDATIALTEKLYEISLDYTLAPADLTLGDALLVTTSSDPQLQGKTLFVSRVIGGTIRVSRRVEATRKLDGSSKH